MRVAMLLHKSVEHDSRVRRAARALAEAGHEVVVLHLPPTPGEMDGELDGFEVRSVTPSTSLRRFKPVRLGLSVLAFIAALRRLRPGAVHAHDAAMLVPGWAGARLAGALLVYDSHELATGVPYRERLWAALVAAIERLLVPRCDLVITVSDGIAERLGQLYPLRRPPAVVRNFPDDRDYAEGNGSTDLRDRHAVPAGATLAVHLGAAARDRGCETLVRSLAGADGVHLLFLGADGAYSAGLREVATSSGVADRVHFQPSVPVADVLSQAGQASVGVSLLEDTCENHRLALPNKVFEYLAAGIPVVASDLPELRRLLADEDAAVLVDPADESAVATAIRQAGEIDRPSTPSRFRWQDEAARLTAAYAELDGVAPASERWSIGNPGNAAARAELTAAIDDLVGAEVRRGASVLDSGCGTGWLLEALAERGAAPERLAGIDADPARVEAAAARVPGARVEVATMQNLSREDESVDLVFFIVSLSSLPSAADVRAALVEGRRVLRPGGALLVYEPRFRNPVNPDTRMVTAADLAAAGAAPGPTRTLTLLPQLSRRLGRATPRAYPLLARLRPIRSHRVFLHRK